jgi:predicted RNase H-like HicB family nuclease
MSATKRLTLFVEQGEGGWFYVTSPDIRGLLVAGNSIHAALAQVQQAAHALLVAKPVSAPEAPQ